MSAMTDFPPNFPPAGESVDVMLSGSRTQVPYGDLMKRVLVVSILVAVAGGLACRQKTAGAPAAAPAPVAVTPAAPAHAATAPPSSTSQPAEAVKPVPAELPSVVARVNGESIERWELESALKQAEASAGSSVPPEERDGVLRNILGELVNYHMLALEARARKVVVTD